MEEEIISTKYLAIFLLLKVEAVDFTLAPISIYSSSSQGVSSDPKESAQAKRLECLGSATKDDSEAWVEGAYDLVGW